MVLRAVANEMCMFDTLCASGIRIMRGVQSFGLWIECDIYI